MPIYEVQTPDGRTLEVEGDTMPSEDELKQFSASLPPIEKPSPLNTAALGAFSGWTSAAESAGMAALGAREILPPTTLMDLAKYGTGIVDEIKRRATRSKVQLVKDVTQAVEPATFSKKYWDEAVPRTPEEKESLWGQIPEAATSMAGYVVAGAAGPLGPPALIGAESAVKHIVGDFENLKQNFGEEEAADIAIQRGLTSGVLQAAVFKYLPKPLQARAQALIRGRLAQGQLGRYVENLGVHAASTGALMGAAAIPENLVAGEPALANVPTSIAGGALLGTATGAMQLPSKIPTAGQLQRLRAEPPRLPATPELRAQRFQTVDRVSAESGFPSRWIETRFPGREGDVTQMSDEGVIVHSRPAWIEYLEQYKDAKMPDDVAIERAISHESLHGGQIGFEGWREQASSFWDNFTGLEKMAFKRIVMGPKPKDAAALKAYEERANDPVYLGRESSRYWSQRMSDIGPSEMSDLKSRGEFTIRTMDALLAFVRWLRNAWGTKANQHQLDYLDKIEKNANEAKKGAQDASKKPKATAVHGDVRTLQKPAEALSVPEGGEGVQPQAEGRLEEPEEVLLDQQRAYKAGQDILSISRKNPLVAQHLPQTNKPLKGEKIVGAVVISPETGELAEAQHHPAAAEKLGEPTETTREQRNDEFHGFSTNKRPFVPRELAGRIAQQSGQALTFRDRAFPHSDEIIHPDDPAKTLSGDPITEAHRAPRKVSFKKAPAKDEAALAKLGFSPEDIAGMSNEEAAAVIEVQATKPGFRATRTASPTAAPKPAAPPKRTARQMPALNPQNPYAERLNYSRNLVAYLENEARRNPDVQSKLDDARVNLAESQKQYNLAEKAPPGVTQGAQGQAPSPVGTITGGAAPGEPVIRQPTLGREVGQPKEPGPAQRAYEEHDEMIRQKIKSGGIQTRQERLRNAELLRAALEENPSLADEPGIGMTMAREEASPEYDRFMEELRSREFSKPGGTNRANAAGLAVRSIAQLEELKVENNRIRTEMKRLRDAGKIDEALKFGTSKVQLPREAIETATNTGSNALPEFGGFGPNVPRPMDWRFNREAADWVRRNAKELDLALPDQFAASAPGMTMVAETPTIRERQEEPWEIQNARSIVTQYESGALSASEYKNYRRAKDTVDRYDSAPGMSMYQGRAVPPYTRDEAQKIAEELFPDHPRGALAPIVKNIVEAPSEYQDEYINDMRRQLFVDEMMKEQSRQMEVRERVEAGTVKRLTLPPEVEGNLIASLFARFKTKIKPVALQQKALEPVKVGKTRAGGPKMVLPTAEEPKAVKMRYLVADPIEFLEDARRKNPMTKEPPNPYLVQLSNRQLLTYWDRAWQMYLRHAPAEEMDRLRTAYGLDTKTHANLRGFIPEPELDPVLRMFYNFGSGEMDADKMLMLAKKMRINTSEDKDWQKKVMAGLLDRVRPQMRDMALAQNIDVYEEGWERELLRKLFGREDVLVEERLKYLAQGATQAQAIQLANDYNDSLKAAYRRRARLERMLLQRGSSPIFIARKSPSRDRISLEDIQWNDNKSEPGAYAQFAKIGRGQRLAIERLGLDIEDKDIEWLDTSMDLEGLTDWLVDGEGGGGAGQTKKVTFLYNSKTRDVDAVSTYRNLRTKEAMVYDPRGQPGHRDRDYLRIRGSRNKLPDYYRFLGSAQLHDPVGYFHQRWASDESGSGLKKFWMEVGETANAAARGDEMKRRVTKRKQIRRQKALEKKLGARYDLSESELRAREELDRLEQLDDEEAKEHVRKMMEAEEARARKEAEAGEEESEKLTVAKLSDYEKRFARLEEMQQEGETEEIGAKVGAMDLAALQEWESNEAQGLLRSRERDLYVRDVTHNEAMELSKLFLRFKIRSDSLRTFSADMEEVLKYFDQTLYDMPSGRNASVLSAFKKMVVRMYLGRIRGAGAIDELRASAKKAGKTIAQHRQEYYEQKQQKAINDVLKEIYEIHSATRGEVAAEERRTRTPRARYIHENYELYPERFAQRVLESFGDNSPRYLEALSVSPKRAAARAVRELADGGRLKDVQIPSPPFTKKNANEINQWLRTQSAQHWLPSPEGLQFLQDVAEVIMAHKSLSNRILGAKVLSRGLLGKTGRGPIPTGKLPAPVPPRVPEVTQGPAIAFVSSPSSQFRPRAPSVVGRQLAAHVDLQETASRLSNLDNRLAVESWTPVSPEKERIKPGTITVRDWLQSVQGKQYLAQRWGMRKGPTETIEKLHERLMQRIESSLMVESRLQPSAWADVSPDIEMSRGAPGMTMTSGTVGRRLREERNKELGLPPPQQPADASTIPELLAMGPIQYMKGPIEGNPELIRERFKRGGRLSTPERALLIWWDFQLQREVNQMYNDPNFGPNHPETRAAEAEWIEWSDWEQAGSGRSAHEALVMRQGVQDIETGSWVAMKREYRRAKAERGQEPDAFEEAELNDLVDEQQSADASVGQTEEKIRTARSDLSDIELLIPPEQKEQVESALPGMLDFLDRVGKPWEKKEKGGAPMAMRGGKASPLNPQEREALIANAVRVMLELSKKDSFSEASWRSTMLKKYPSSAPYLSEVWDPAQKYRDQIVTQVLGNAKATEIARKYMTRTRPTIEQSRKVIERAYAEFPKTSQISPMEAVHAWNFIEQAYFQKISDIPGTENFDAVLKLAAADLKIPRERLYQALRANKTMRVLTNELSQRMDKANRVRAHVRSWIDSKREPKMALIAKVVPSVFFMDKIVGHGFVGMITHASNLMFQPWAWRDYFRGWANMYKSVHSKAYHIEMIRSIERDEMFRFAKRMGAEVDPHRFTGDYEVGGWYRWLREKTYGRGFDALKKLRLDLFKTWWQAIPPELRTEQMGKLIANDVNHMTGIVHSKFPTWSNYTFFAPKLAASQWGVLVTDPAKAAMYLTNWRSASPEQMRWAKMELWHKAQMVGLYAVGLALNAGILKVTNSKQEINWDDPKRSDFWSFKIAGFNVGVTGPMIQIVRMFSDLAHIAMGAQSQLEKTRNRPERFLSRLTEYARRKASPFAGFGLDVVTGQDFMGRPLPWSSDVVPRSKRLKGVAQYEPLEWALQTLSPIPIEEAIKELWANMGLNKSTASKIWHSLAVAAPMALTGARIWEDPEAAAMEESEEPAKGPLTFY